MSAIEQTTQRKERKVENRQPDYVVRAKTWPGRKGWSTVGYAWKRENGEGFSVKLDASINGFCSPRWMV